MTLMGIARAALLRNSRALHFRPQPGRISSAANDLYWPELRHVLPPAFGRKLYFGFAPAAASLAYARRRTRHKIPRSARSGSI